MFFQLRDNAKMYYRHNKFSSFVDTIILIHGLGMDSTTWSLLALHLQQQYNVIIYDLRGHGMSEPGQESLTWDLLCEDLHQLTKHLAVPKFHLAGHGFGGLLAVCYAQKHPDHVQSLMLLATPLYSPRNTVQKEEKLRRALLGNGSIVPLAKRLLERVCHPLTKEKEKLLFNAFSKVSIACYQQLLEIAVKLLHSSTYGPINVPVLLLAGEYDHRYPPALLGLSTALLPQSSLLVIPKASNMMQLDRPDKVADWAHHFIQESRFSANMEKFESTSEMHDQIRKLIANIPATENVSKRKLNYIKIDVLQQFKIEINDVEIQTGWNKRNAKELLVFLVYHKSATREQLCDYFWPDVHIQKARNNLRVALNHLKQLFTIGSTDDSPIFLIDREYIRLAAKVECDLLAIMEKLENFATEKDDKTKAMIASKILHGIPKTILPGFYDEWLLDLREQLEEQYHKIARWMANYCKETGELNKAIQYLNIALRFQQYDPQIYNEIVELYQKGKKHPAAVH